MRRTPDEGGGTGEDARRVIEKLELSRHPEGGWFRETWRDVATHAGRALGTAILYLLESGQRSHWHRVDGSELWLHQGGGAIRLLTYTNGGVIEHRLGPDFLAGDQPQAVVPPGVWQAAETGTEWALVSCIVVPGFEEAGFEMAAPEWDPTQGAPD